jgi:hypothetical protein
MTVSTTTAADRFLMGDGAPGLKFETIGDKQTGTIVEPPEVRQQTDPKDNSLKFWPDGNPQMQLVVTLQTTYRDGPDDNGRRRWYIKGKSMTDETRDAVKRAGAKGLEVGGVPTIIYVADGLQQNKALNKPKLYKVDYQRPDGAAASGDFLGVQQPAAAPAPAPAATPAAPVASGPTPAQIAALKAAGIDPATVFPGYTG